MRLRRMISGAETKSSTTSSFWTISPVAASPVDCSPITTHLCADRSTDTLGKLDGVLYGT
jgi:hypothetical protein